MSKIVLGFALFCLVRCVAPVGAVAQMAGDANGDSVVNVVDVVYEINYLFIDGPPPVVYECGDPNTDCRIDASDVVYLINYLFIGGPDPQIVGCDWSEPVNLGLPINSSAGEGCFRVSPDGRIAIWSSNRPGGYGNDDIWYSYWNSISGSWSEPQNCGGNVNNGADDVYPSLSPDRQKLYCRLFGRPGTLGNYWDVWVSTWDSLLHEWGPIENLGPTINLFGAGTPFISPDGTKLYFSNYGIWFSEKSDTGWGEPVWLGDNVNVDGSETDPTVTADNKTLYFSRYRGYPYWYSYICVSHWTGTEWGPAVVLGPSVNDSISVKCPYISPDGSKLYFISRRPGGFGITDVWMSERIPINKATGQKPQSKISNDLEKP